MSETDEDSFIQLPLVDISASGSCGMTAEQILQEIEKCQDMGKALEIDWLLLKASKEESDQEASRLQKEVDLLHRRLLEFDDETLAYELTFQEEMPFELRETDQLLQEKQQLENELEKLDRLSAAQEKYKVPPTLPDRRMVFRGKLEKEGTPSDMLAVKPHIQFPIPGGSALVTFESPEVASQIIEMKQHQVQMDKWSYVWVKAEPVTLVLPKSLEISVEQSPRQILLSGLPVLPMSEEQLVDKLELFFSKRQNNGGEVERIERLTSSGHVVLTFLEDGVVEKLVQKGWFQVPLGKKTYEIKVSPYVTGQLTNLQFHPSVCTQTVLLSGIPDVMEEEMMREVLEIHFQKPSKGGGELETIVYVPAGKRAVAVFEAEE